MELPPAIIEKAAELARAKKIPKEELLKKAKERYEAAQIEPGEAIGVVTAQSIGEPGTQLTMRTKWFAGATEMTITQGLPRIIEVFDAKKEPSTPSMIIYLKKKYARSEEEVKKVASKILEIRLSDIAKEFRVDLARLRVEVIFDLKKLKEHKLKVEKIAAMLKESMKGVRVTSGKEFVAVNPKTDDLKEVYKLRAKLMDFHVKGIKGITHVLPVKEGDEWVIKTAGTNLKEVLKLPEVDPVRTTTNDIFEIFRVLGIEAARNAIIEEVKKVLDAQGVEVDVRHIMLVADMMTCDGVIKGIGRYGISGEKASVLARASFEVPLQHLFKAAMRNEKDPLTGVVENVMINQPITVGTGIVDLVVKGDLSGKTE